MTRPGHTTVSTPAGPGELVWDLAAPVAGVGGGQALLVISHGAGGDIDAPDLVELARVLPGYGISVARYRQPWRVAGRRIATPPRTLDEGWIPAVAAARDAHPHGALVVGGRSAGARVACRTADHVEADVVFALAFPLHPPERPEKSRLAELLAPSCPRVVVQGTRDRFGGSAEVIEALGDATGVTVSPMPDAGHDLTPARRAKVSPTQWSALLIDPLRAALARGSI